MMDVREAINELHNIRPRGGIIPQKRAEAIDIAIEAMEKQSEIVHCKDCEYWDKDLKCVSDIGDYLGVCMHAKWFCGEEGFCLYGKRVE